MAKKKIRFKGLLAKHFNSLLLRTNKRFKSIERFDLSAFNPKTLNSILNLRIFLDFVDPVKIGKKQNRKLRSIDGQLMKSHQILTGLQAYEASVKKLNRLFPDIKNEDEVSKKFRSSVINLFALEKRAIQSESMVRMQSLNVSGNLSTLKTLSKKGKLVWAGKKKIIARVSALDLLLNKQRKKYNKYYSKLGPLHPRTIQLLRQLSRELNAAIRSQALLLKLGATVNSGKNRKYKLVEKRINNFLGLYDLNILLKRVRERYGSVSGQQLISILEESERKIDGGFSFKTPQKKAVIAQTSITKAKITSTAKPKVTAKTTTAKPKVTATAKPKTTAKTTTAKPKVTATAKPKVTAKTTKAKPKVTATAKPKVTAKTTTTKRKVTAAAKPKVTAKTTTAKPKVTATAKPKVTAKTTKAKPKVTATAKPKVTAKTTTTKRKVTAATKPKVTTKTTTTKPKVTATAKPKVTAKTTKAKPKVTAAAKPKVTAKTTTTKPKVTAAAKPKVTAKTTTAKPKVTATAKPKVTAKTTTPAKRRGRLKKEVKNDLTKIRGIGPKVEAALNSVGIVTYRQMTMISEAEHQKLDKLLSSFHGRARRETWAKEAAELSKAS